jgi:aerobic C4-dicarboxylate transport protein
MKILKLCKQLYFQVILGILIGILLGHFYPDIASKMKPLGDGFIKLIRTIIPLIIFTTVVGGIYSLKNLKEAGRIGIKAIIYFEVMTTLAMLLGLVVANFFQPGADLNINIQALDSTEISGYVGKTASFDLIKFILNIIPNTLISAFTQGDSLQVLFVSTLFGFALLKAGEKGKSIVGVIENFSQILFSIIKWIMKIAPIGAFGAISYTIGTYGIHSLTALSKLLACFYLTCAFFICVILGLMARLANFSLLDFLKYIKEELFIVLGTATTETVLPSMINKLEKKGCSRSVAAFVLPAGYAFNLDGMSIYLTIAFMFIAQAFHLDISFQQQVIMIFTFMLMSKGAANVTGGGFIALATVISSTHTIPVEGLVLLLGIDRFMSEARSLTNLIGNAVATMVISKWEDNFNASKENLGMHIVQKTTYEHQLNVTK